MGLGVDVDAQQAAPATLEVPRCILDDLASAEAAQPGGLQVEHDDRRAGRGASSSARNRLVSLRPKVPAGRIVAVIHAVSDTAAAGRLCAKNCGLLNARTVHMVTSSRPTAVVDRCSDCRPLACEQPVATGNVSSEPRCSGSHGGLKGRSEVEQWL
jgi:hypothetical protein